MDYVLVILKTDHSKIEIRKTWERIPRAAELLVWANSLLDDFVAKDAALSWYIKVC